jgi:hypothetical protein
MIMSAARTTVANAKSKLNQYHASRNIVPSVPFAQRMNPPWIGGGNGRYYQSVAYRAGCCRVGLK